MADEDDNNLSTQDWLDLAREALIREGLSAVKVERLAKAAGVSRGGFYWRFESRQDLLDQLLDDWRSTNTTSFLRAVSGPGTPGERFKALAELWIDEQDFRPDYDKAVRNWAAESPRVAEIVHTVDIVRVDALRGLFLDAGCTDDEALVRARMCYYIQIGYYALGIKQSAERRRQLEPLYYRFLTGFTDGDALFPPLESKARRAGRGKRSAR